MLEITGFFKTAEIDNYENGCTGDYSCYDIRYPISADNLDQLKEKILSFIDVDSESIELNACDEIGRIDVCKMENAEGYTPTNSEMERFKAGEIDLYYCVYTCYVESVTRERVKL